MGLFGGGGIGKVLGAAGSIAGAYYGGNVGAALGAAGSFLGSAAQNQALQDAASAAYANNVDFYQHRYQWQVDDLKKAGLNPMLAYTNGAPSGPPSPVASVENTTQGSINTGMRARELEANLALVDAQRQRELSQTRLNEASASAQQADASLKEALIPKYSQDIVESKANVQLITARIGEVDQNILTSAAEQSFKESQVHLNSVQEDRLRHEIKLLAAQANLTSAQVREVAHRIKNLDAQSANYEASTRFTGQGTENAKVEWVLKKYSEAYLKMGMGRAFNESAAQESWFKQHISPYLPDFGSASSAAAAASRVIP